MKFEGLMKILKRNAPNIDGTEVLATCRHIKMILSEWKLSVQSDILTYLSNDFDIEDLEKVRNKEVYRKSTAVLKGSKK